MRIATKTLTSLLIVTMLTISVPSVATATSSSRSSNNRQKGNDAQIDKITQRYDRKLELRASILGTNPEDLKDELKSSSFDQVLKKHGFKNREFFKFAITGKIKDELKKRGWSEDKIQKVIDKRIHRLENKA